MALRVRCPGCGLAMTLTEDERGKRLRCKQCREVFTADEGRRGVRAAMREEEDDDRPRRRRRREDDYDDEPPRRRRGRERPSGSSTGLLVGGLVGGAVLLVVLCCGGFGILAYWARNNPAVVVQDGAIPPPAPPANPPQNPGPGVVSAPPAPRPNKPGPAEPPVAKPPVAQAPALVPWVVKPDPPPAGLDLPEKAEGTIPITAPSHGPNNVVDEVIFPTSPSPFVSVAAKGPIHDAHEVWDLRTMKKVGRVEPEDPFTRAALSPDGAYWAKPNFMLKGLPGADAYAVADGKHFRITVTNEKSKVIDNVDFAGPGQLVTIHDVVVKDGVNVVVDVWDIKRQALVLGFGAPGYLDRNQRAFSPGRRYIALATRLDRVQLHDLSGGHLAGELPLPAGAKCLGLSFAPDGKSLAGLFKVDNTTRLLAWNLDAATGSAHLMLDPNAVPKVTVYQGPALEWLPDGGWLLYGRALVDKAGAVYGRIPTEDGDWTPRHVLPGGRVAYVKRSGGSRSLVIEPLPAEATRARR